MVADSNYFSTASFSWDGQRIMTLGNDGVVKLWDSRPGR
jgi:hypothetical protein